MKALVMFVFALTLMNSAVRAPPTIQNPSSSPTAVSGAQRPKASGTNSAPSSAAIAAQRRRRASCGPSPLRQASSGPMPASRIAGAISGANTDSK